MRPIGAPAGTGSTGMRRRCSTSPSRFGIEEGHISKLRIKNLLGQVVFDYDRRDIDVAVRGCWPLVYSLVEKLEDAVHDEP